MIFKHTEYKLVCDGVGCLEDLTEYTVAENKTDAMKTLRRWAKDNGAKYNSFNKKWFCENCKDT